MCRSLSSIEFVHYNQAPYIRREYMHVGKRKFTVGILRSFWFKLDEQLTVNVYITCYAVYLRQADKCRFKGLLEIFIHIHIHIKF